jgi:ABC-2 type transport system ATP-binding protein
MTMAAMIATTGLTKDYGGARGIHGVDLTVDEGEIFGFLGPNGAGKTTTIRLLLGLLRPTAGRATIAGHDCWTDSTAVKRLVGYLPGEFACDPALTGAQILTYLGNLRGGVDTAHRDRLIARLEFDPTRRFRDYSRGNKQKIGLIQAFMGRPRLLILDEPTAGLDPLNQQVFNEIVTEAHRDGATIFLSSHILPEVEHLCERVAVIREGRLIAVERVAALTARRQQALTVTFPDRVAPEAFTALPGVEATATADGRTLQITVADDLGPVLRLAAEQGALALTSHEPNLEEVFLRLYEGESAVGSRQSVATR